jgi:hypothetical protein
VLGGLLWIPLIQQDCSRMQDYCCSEGPSA